MKTPVRLSLSLVVVALGLGCGTTDDTSTARQGLGTERVDVCHGLGNGGVIRITVDDNAVPAHVRHGDEAAVDVWPDADGDGFGDGSEDPTSACETPEGFADNDTDCDDADTGVNPGAAEVCDNGVDDNCNDEVDEGCLVICVKPFAVPDRWIEVQTPPFDPEDTFDAAAAANPDVYVPPAQPNATGYNGALDHGQALAIHVGAADTIEASAYFPIALGAEVGETGGDAYQASIEGCSPSHPPVGAELVVETGSLVGPTRQGVEALIGSDPAAFWDDATQSVAGSAFAHSPRVFAIPLYDPAHYDQTRQPNGAGEVVVAGLLGMFLEAFDDGTLYGRIVALPRPLMRFLHTMIRVGDLDRAIAFYTGVLGMTLLRRKDYPGGEFTLAFVGYGPEESHTVLELTHNWGTDSYHLGTGYGHIALGVDDIHATCARIQAAGGKITRPPGPMKHGTTVIAFVEDPDGYKIELIEGRG